MGTGPVWTSLVVASGCWKACIWGTCVLRLSRAFLDLGWQMEKHHSPPYSLLSAATYSTLGGVFSASLKEDLHALLEALSLAAENSSRPSPTLEKPTDGCAHSLLLNKDLGDCLLMQKVLVLISGFIAYYLRNSSLLA